MFKITASTMAHAIAGLLMLSATAPATALGVTSAQPSALAPGLPTVAAAGLPGYEAATLNGLFAPAKTPAVIIGRLNHESAPARATPDVKARLFKSGSDALGSTAEEFVAIIKADMTRMDKVIKAAGIREE